MNHRLPSLRLLIAAIFLLAAGLSCSLGAAGRPSLDQAATRTPRPTFTPVPGLALSQPETAGGPVKGLLPPGVTVLPPGTAPASPDTGLVVTIVATPMGQAPLSPLSTPTPPPASVTPPPTVTRTPTAGPTATPRPTPYVVVSAGAVLARRGPAPSFDLLGEVRQGQALMILATIPDKSWWQVCCVANQPAWVVASAVSAQGPVEVVPSIPVPATPTLAPTLTPAPTFTLTPTPAPPFDIAAGPQFPMTRDDGNTVIWVKVYEDSFSPKPLAGYVLKVLRNGVDVSLPVQSHNKTSGFDNTGPRQGNFEYNLKFEMAQGGEADWQFYLARPDGSRVSPISKFTTMGDSYRNQVVYIAYFLAR